MQLFWAGLITGLNTGAILIVATIGFSLILWIDDFFNVAHAELLVVGAFLTYYIETNLHATFVLAALGAIVGTGLVACLMNISIYNPMRGHGRVTLLITALGAFFISYGVIGSIVSPGVYSVHLPTLGSFVVEKVSVSWYYVIDVGLAAVVILAVGGLLSFTTTGLKARALADSKLLSVARGVSEKRVSVLVWAVVGATAGLAGVMLSMNGTINTEIGTQQMLLIVSVAILAGVGSVIGLAAVGIVSGLILGIVGTYVPEVYAEAILFVVMIGVLAIRPRGIFGSSLHRREV